MRLPDLGRVLAAASLIAVISAIIAGLIIIRSPAEMQERDLDEQRLENIADIVKAMDCYLSFENALPADFAELQAGFARQNREVTIPPGCPIDAETDPVTGAPYDYTPLGGTRFEVCAVFAHPSESGVQRIGMRRFETTHPAGRHCFRFKALKIDFATGHPQAEN